MAAPARQYDAIVIGAGPAGMMAAGRAGERGKRVLLLEKNDFPGKKLLISGRGRCNVTNAGTVEQYLDNFSKGGLFLRNAFARVFTEELTRFFGSRGVRLKTEHGRRVFPESDRSTDILKALLAYLAGGKVDLSANDEVRDIRPGIGGAKTVVTRRGSYLSQHVAICTGGVSYSATGSTGFGFGMAKRLGHRVMPQRPALIPLVARLAFVKSWQGVILKNIEAAVITGGRRVLSRFGDMLFTHFGLSGPVILDVSASVYDLLKGGKDVDISVNFKPALDRTRLDRRLVREFQAAPNRGLKNVFRELLPAAIIEDLLKTCGADPAKRCGNVKREERRILVERLLDFRIGIRATRPIDEAIVTRGGVDTKQIDPKTMESRLVKGIFFAGELIDVDAKTGGYNMQAAFSTGFLCGENL